MKKNPNPNPNPPSLTPPPTITKANNKSKPKKKPMTPHFPPPPPAEAAMDYSSTPPSRRAKVPTPSRLAHPFDDDPPQLSIPLKDLLLLSPSPRRRPHKPRTVADDPLDPLGPAPGGMTPRRRAKNRGGVSAAGVSPRNARRARKRLEKETLLREELEPTEDDGRRARRRRLSRPKGGSYKEKMALVVPSVPCSSPLPEMECDGDGGGSLDGMWEQILELVMWRNAAKSTLWFGAGSMFFISSCLSTDLNFSIISAVSHLGILVLGLAFFYDSFSQRHQNKQRRVHFRLTEEDILRVARQVLPVTNAALAKSQDVFSGDPVTTLKVAPVLLFMAKYGYLITLWRLLATGFFLSFTLPKVCSCYSEQIQQRVENTNNYVRESWKSCPRKKFLAASTATILWNLFSVKMRIFAAFISIVAIRCHHQQQHAGEENGPREKREEKEEQHAGGEKNGLWENREEGQQQAIVIA